jgi:hypothetical protein
VAAEAAGRARHRPHLLRAVVHLLVVSHWYGDASLELGVVLGVQCLLW